MAKNFSDKYISSLKPKDKTYTIREAKGFYPQNLTLRH
jgi:hypothetical protein